ncbi:MAG: nucleotidyl transferase AbiEii/AbiGii toxin family protein [Sandaracinaceae bacterium]|nr:nucleotidyl transferase AbiEii/AbiGii toxin family protein [Sandaracinaceae bacterium]
MTAHGVAASVRARLLNRSRAEGRPFQELLEYFAMERFLYRLSRSPHAGHFVLKGALMLQLWHAERARSTRDIDLLGLVPPGVDEVASRIREVLAQPVEDDGVVFDVAGLTAAEIPDTLQV